MNRILLSGTSCEETMGFVGHGGKREPGANP